MENEDKATLKAVGRKECDHRDGILIVSAGLSRTHILVVSFPEPEQPFFQC